MFAAFTASRLPLMTPNVGEMRGWAPRRTSFARLSTNRHPPDCYRGNHAALLEEKMPITSDANKRSFVAEGRYRN